MRYVLATLLAICGISEAGASQLLATGPLEIDGNNVAVCNLINIGSAGVTLSPVGIYVDRQPLPASSNTCGTTLLPGKTCRVVESTEIANYFECRVSVSDKTNIRGELEDRQGSVTVRHEAMR
jgi:hypothetical protein